MSKEGSGEGLADKGGAGSLELRGGAGSSLRMRLRDMERREEEVESLVGCWASHDSSGTGASTGREL